MSISWLLEEHSLGGFEWGRRDCLSTAIQIHRGLGRSVPRAVLREVREIYRECPSYREVMAKGADWIMETWDRLLRASGWRLALEKRPGNIVLLRRRNEVVTAFRAEDFQLYCHSLELAGGMAIVYEWQFEQAEEYELKR